MSSLYTQISQAAAEQKQQVAQSAKTDKATPKPAAADRSSESTDSQPDRTVAAHDRTDQPNGSSVRTTENTPDAVERTVGQDKQTQRENGQAASLIDEMEHGIDRDVRATERYSFEIYTDQKDRILEIKYRYEKRTGKRLPKSRIIREALDHYFEQVLDH